MGEEMKKPLLNETSKPLSEKEEQLLMRFQDGEASWREQWTARRLISARSEARDFLADVGFCGEFVQWRAHRMLRQLPPVWTLFTEVQRTIDKQECVRKVVIPMKGRWALSAEMIARAGWGVTGALTAASVMILMTPIGVHQGKREGEDISSRDIYPQNIPLTPVYFESSKPRVVGGSETRINSSYPFKSSAVGEQYGITWFSSGGKMQVIGGRSPNSPVLWVSRNGRVSRRASPTPDIPSAVFASEKRESQPELLSR